MKILITTEFYLPFQCGVTTAVINERKCLEAIGHEVRILTIHKEKTSEYRDGVYYMRSNIPQLYKDSYAAILFTDPLLEDIYEWQPDLVHSQCEFFTMIYAKRIARKFHIPLVHTCHTDFESYSVHFTKSLKLWDWATSTFIPKLLKTVDYIICPSKKSYDLLKSYGIKNPMKIMPSGIDLSHLNCSLDAEERTKLRICYGISPDDVLLVSVCRLSEEKNVKESIEHFNELQKVRKNVKLLIVGDGDERENLENQVKELQLEEKVSFTGNVPMDEVWKYFKLGDIFVSSSRSETQGLTYIEALACSLPVVCLCDSVLSLFLEPGINGFDFSDSENFLKVVMPLVDDRDERLKIGKNAYKSVERYSLENFAKNLMTIFDEVIEKKQQESTG